MPKSTFRGHLRAVVALVSASPQRFASTVMVGLLVLAAVAGPATPARAVMLQAPASSEDQIADGHPFFVKGVSTTPQIATGDIHTCALLSDGTVRCWGSGGNGRLGDGMTADSSNPVAVLESGGTPLGGVIQIATGDAHTCALLSAGTVRCWGSGGNGRLGDGATTDRSLPVVVLESDGTPLGGVIQIATGSAHTCALLSAGTVRCWGSGGFGRLGDGATTDRSLPVVVLESGGTPLGGVIQIATGGFHTCALLEDVDKTVRCWGFGGRGRLGDGTTTTRLNPVEVLESDGTPLGGVTQIATGGFHTCALLAGKTVRCWGFGGLGQLGDGTRTDGLNPVAVLESGSTPLGQVTRIATGSAHTCALLSDGTVRCWGSGGNGQLGDGTTTDGSNPVVVLESDGTPLGGVTQIATGGAHTCALLEDAGRTVRCWGLGDNGQLGDGSTTNRSLPVAVLASGSAALDPVVFSVIVVHLVDSGASGESVSRLEMACDVIPAQVGELITCTVTGGDPGIDILWRAAYNPVFAGAGVTLDGSGTGEFSFTVPTAALGQSVTVELVDWLAPVSIGVAGGPVPTSVPSGGGPVPVWSLVVLALAGGLALRRMSAVGARA
jgi:alpha-tubulin suppressor-like RCC1 family protein